jgi:hypothetical protein
MKEKFTSSDAIAVPHKPATSREVPRQTLAKE